MLMCGQAQDILYNLTVITQSKCILSFINFNNILIYSHVMNNNNRNLDSTYVVLI
jgi:hypothetical protein